MNNHKGKSKLSTEAFRLLQECVIAEVAFTVIVMLLLAFLKALFNQVIWYWENPSYRFLKFFKEREDIFIPVLLFLGWLIITYHFMSRFLAYLDEISDAAKKLATPTNEHIVLSNVLHDTEVKLNHVREQALENIRITKDAEQRKNDLVAYLAHDLKTPLTSVIGYLTILKEESEISEPLRQKYLSISLNKAERLEDLINEFFEITQFNLSEISLNCSEINLTLLFQQLISEFEPMLLQNNLQCKLKVDSNLIIGCDVDKMQRVFDNLLRNAVNYSFQNSVITISAKSDDNTVYIEFQNQGYTISPEKLNLIFEQFYRADLSRGSKNGGSGLGLAIAKKIVERHNGSIQAESENNIIKFIVQLPKYPMNKIR